MNSALEPIHHDTDQAKVLLVDDDEVTLLLCSIALRERGFQVMEASSGAKALQSLADYLPDVVVIDALMPDMDGFQMCEALRSIPGYESLPVLMMTGLDDEASIERAYQAGATDFFVKSNQWGLLVGRLRYLLRSSRIRAELELSKSKLARAQDLARMGSFEWEFGRVHPKFSPEALRVFGLGQSPSLSSIMHMLNRVSRPRFLAWLRQSKRESAIIDSDVAVQLSDTKTRIIHVEAEPNFNDHGQLISYSGILQDVTERRNAEEKIQHLANFDTLTGLPNRRQLIWRTEKSIEHAEKHHHNMALLIIGIDRFKVVNDTLGYGAGDELLIEIARRLRSCVHHTDHVEEHVLKSIELRSHQLLESVGRLGGDEFIALLPEVLDQNQAEMIARRILKAFREPVVTIGQECFVTASVGVALYPRDGMNVADLMRSADIAMSAAKNAGRNDSATYSPNLLGKNRDKLALETALHKAMERNELVLHYQPKIDVNTAKMVGVEALMRWNREGKLVFPGDFIPLAEETGLIIPMSEWAIAEASRQAQVWKEKIQFVDKIAVNLPSRLFQRPDIVELIARAVAVGGGEHRYIELEITETGLMQNIKGVIPILQSLNDQGVQISVDDFGTGYSSLSYLTSLPISELKIDRSFVNRIGDSMQSSAVVTAIIALARSLGLRVIAEGVETIQQMEVLHRLGCNIMQGYLFCKPQSPIEIEKWLSETVHVQQAPWINVALSLPPPRYIQQTVV